MCEIVFIQFFFAPIQSLAPLFSTWIILYILMQKQLDLFWQIMPSNIALSSFWYMLAEVSFFLVTDTEFIDQQLTLWSDLWYYYVKMACVQ